MFTSLRSHLLHFTVGKSAIYTN